MAPVGGDGKRACKGAKGDRRGATGASERLLKLVDRPAIKMSKGEHSQFLNARRAQAQAACGLSAGCFERGREAAEGLLALGDPARRRTGERALRCQLPRHAQPPATTHRTGPRLHAGFGLAPGCLLGRWCHQRRADRRQAVRAAAIGQEPEAAHPHEARSR